MTHKFRKEIEDLHNSGSISELEIGFAHFLNRISEEAEGEVLAAGMMCVLYQINGHICVPLEEIYSGTTYTRFFEGISSVSALRKILIKSDLIGDGGELTPLVLDRDNLYMQKYWKYEQELAEWIIKKSLEYNSLSTEVREFIVNQFEKIQNPDWQQIAVLISLAKNLVIISGGPGTGKTYTIRRIIEALQFENEDLIIALAAPTGKAAQRLNDSLDPEADGSVVRKAVTVHKLLGARGTSGQFSFNKKNKLPFDVVIVDEASMLDISIWINLIRALPEGCKLILLGDKNQLASVEAGSILGDICGNSTPGFSREIIEHTGFKTPQIKESSHINDSIVLLSKSYRFGEKSGIKLLADVINTGDSDAALDILTSDSFPEVRFRSPSNSVIEQLIRDYAIDPYNQFVNGAEAAEFFSSHRILCALRKGPFGVEHINELTEQKVKQHFGVSLSKEWYQGRPVLITRNNATLRLRNGESGICVKQNGELKILFENKEQAVSVSRIQNYEPAFANTIHKSQGSEYEDVAVLLSNAVNPVLSKELLYTSVTRARKSLLVIGSEEIIRHTIAHNISRKSGLIKKIWKDNDLG